jgi:glycosyltransferase involved in cell wall biosynthesis
VFTGQQTSHWAKLRRLVEELHLGDKVIHLGFVSAELLDRIYAGAEAVVFPTRFEGFGLPVLEAVERRKKIVVSRLPIFDELGVPRSWQADFEDPDQLAAALALPGPTVVTKRPSTWAEVAQRTIAVLREAGASEGSTRAAR